uniref:T9SS type A sorting domain-containing protein n=1 Tax=candidate division WOR-3 bacterium TaxID=2052148 RepID=A0A7V3PUQ7_UNCW3
MNRTVLTLVLTLGLAAIAFAQMNITGYLYSEMMPVEVDSVYFEYGTNQTWFTTPGWMVNPGETDTFAFPEFAGWPAIIKVQLLAGGMPVYDSLYRPLPDSWYALRPPNDQIKFKFHGETGVQEFTPLNLNTDLPGIVNYVMFLNLINRSQAEVVDYLGRKVSTLSLSPGVYFYRPSGATVYQRLILIH